MAVEFTVHLEDKPGALADLTETLAASAINITAIHATPCPAEGIVQFVTSDTDGTINALGAAGIPYTTTEVLLLSMPDEPGSLARLSRRLGQVGININALYITMGGQVVLNVDELSESHRIALELGFK
jgi:hypothetical protein